MAERTAAALAQSEVANTSVRVTKLAIRQAFGADLPMDYTFVSSETLSGLDAEIQSSNYLIVSMMKDRGIPLDWVKNIAPVATAKGSSTSLRVFLSADFFSGVEQLSPGKVDDRQKLSRASIYIFDHVCSLALQRLPQKIQVNDKMLARTLFANVMDYIHEEAPEDQKGPAKQLSEDLKTMAGSGATLAVVAKGAGIEIKMGENALLPIFAQHDSYIKHMLTIFARNNFVDLMSRRNFWFVKPQQMPEFVPVSKEVKNELDEVLDALKIKDNPRAIFDLYVSSKIGQVKAREIGKGIRQPKKGEHGTTADSDPLIEVALTLPELPGLQELAQHGIGAFAEETSTTYVYSDQFDVQTVSVSMDHEESEFNEADLFKRGRSKNVQPLKKRTPSDQE
jgi:hypothetical protein